MRLPGVCPPPPNGVALIKVSTTWVNLELMKFALDGDCTKCNPENKNQRDKQSIKLKQKAKF